MAAVRRAGAIVRVTRYLGRVSGLSWGEKWGASRVGRRLDE